MKEKHQKDDWSSGTWKGAEIATLRDGMKLTFAQKLAWLEQMQALAGAAQRKVAREGKTRYQAEDK